MFKQVYCTATVWEDQDEVLLHVGYQVTLGEKY